MSTDGPPLYPSSMSTISSRHTKSTVLQHTQTVQYQIPLNQLNNTLGINYSYNNQHDTALLKPSIGGGPDGSPDATSVSPPQQKVAASSAFRTPSNKITNKVHNNLVSSTALSQKSTLNRVTPDPTHAANLVSSVQFMPIGQVGVDEGHVGIDKSRCKRNQPTLDSDDMKAKAADVMTGLVESFKSVVVLRDFVDQCQCILPEMIERCKQLQQQQQHKRIRMNHSQQNIPPVEEEDVYYDKSDNISLNEEVDNRHHSSPTSDEVVHANEDPKSTTPKSTTQEESMLVDESTTLDLKSNADGRKEDTVDDMDDQSSELSTQSDDNNRNQRRKSKRLVKANAVKAKEEKRKLAAVVTIQRAYKQYKMVGSVLVNSDDAFGTSQELTKGQKRHDKQRMVNGISTRNRVCEALRGVDASSLQNASLKKKPSDEQLEIARINNVLSSISTNSGKTDDLVHRLLKAYGLDNDSITKIINRMPDGVLHELKTYIRASPNVNSAKLAGSVLSQHLSHQMSATLHEELHSIDLNHSAPHIAIGHSRHSGKTSEALAHLIHDLIKRIVDAPRINLYVMVTEALRFDESIHVIRQIIDVFKKLKVKELVLDSMELDTVGFAAIGCKHRQKKRDISAVASHRHAGKSIISADLSTQLEIYKAAVPIQDDINAGCTDNVTFNTIDKAKKDGDAFVKKYRNAIEECNKEWQRLLKEVEAGDITVEQAICQYCQLPVLKKIPADEIAKLLDYGRTSVGTSKDPNYQLSLNVAAGRVLYNDDESVERMILRDIHKNRDKLGHEAFAASCMCIGTGHVDRSTVTDPVRIGDNKHQIDMYEELCRQTDTLSLFSRCYGKDIKAVAEMEVWRDREMASVLDECKEEKEEMIGRELKEDRTNHDSFDMLKQTTLSLQVPPEEEEKKDSIIKMLVKQIEEKNARMDRLKEHYARIIETEERLEQEKKEKERLTPAEAQKRKKLHDEISTLLSQNKKKEEKMRLEAEARREKVLNPNKKMEAEKKRTNDETIEFRAQLQDSIIPENLDLITANSKSGYKGVSRKPTTSGPARYTVVFKGRGLGTFDTAEEAAREYARAHYIDSHARI